MIPLSFSATGQLLLATPPLDDPNFERAVIFVLDHSPDGAIGLVLDRATDETLDDELDAWQGWMNAPAVVFDGGPVDRDALIGLATVDPGEEITTLATAIVTVDLHVDPIDQPEPPTRLRIFRGYAGWAPGQLNDELDEGAWMVLPAELDDVFGATPGTLWRRVLRRQGGRLAWVANAPDDLSAN